MLTPTIDKELQFELESHQRQIGTLEKETPVIKATTTRQLTSKDEEVESAEIKSRKSTIFDDDFTISTEKKSPTFPASDPSVIMDLTKKRKIDAVEPTAEPDNLLRKLKKLRRETNEAGITPELRPEAERFYSFVVDHCIVQAKNVTPWSSTNFHHPVRSENMCEDGHPVEPGKNPKDKYLLLGTLFGHNMIMKWVRNKLEREGILSTVIEGNLKDPITKSFPMLRVDMSQWRTMGE